MKEIYIAVRWDYLSTVGWPPGANCGDEAMSIIWGIPNVRFVRNNHRLGDLYKIVLNENDFTEEDLTEEDLLMLTLKLQVGIIVTDIDSVRTYSGISHVR